MTSTQSATHVTPAASQAKSEYRPSLEERELTRLSEEWMEEALVRKNEQRLREIMAPEFTLQIWDASRAAQPLDGWMNTLFHRLDGVQFRYAGLNARVFGDAAMVYSRFSWTGIMDGQPFADSGFMVDFWMKRNGKWQVMSRRSAPQQQIQELSAAPRA